MSLESRVALLEYRIGKLGAMVRDLENRLRALEHMVLMRLMKEADGRMHLR